MRTCRVQVDYSHLMFHTCQCAMGTWLNHVLLYCRFSLFDMQFEYLHLPIITGPCSTSNICFIVRILASNLGNHFH
jgi:hypothetical protein